MLTAYYDLAVCPPTYDIVAFLCAAERERLRGKEDRLSIEILPGPKDGFRDDKFWPYGREALEAVLHHIAMPMAAMLPSGGRDVVLRQARPERPSANAIGLGQRLYGTKTFMECMAVGIRPLRATGKPMPRNPRLVTITLREAEHWPERNSNVPEWLAAAQAIRGRGYLVTIVRDTCKADVPFGDFGIDPQAARHLSARARLYESAVCNLFVNNGPAWMAMALDAAVLMFKPTVENLMPTCSAKFFAACGVPTRGQIPGAPAYQRLVWREDTADAIVEAFEDFIEHCSAAA